MKYWLKLVKKVILSPIELIFKVEEKFTYEKYKVEKQRRENIEKNFKLKEEQYLTQRDKVHELQKKLDNIQQQNKNLVTENDKLKKRNNTLIKQIDEIQEELKKFSESEAVNED